MSASGGEDLGRSGRPVLPAGEGGWARLPATPAAAHRYPDAGAGG